MESYGNVASLRKIGNLYKIRKGIVDKVYYWAIIVIQSSNLCTIKDKKL